MTTTYDPVLKRYRATCDTCDYFAVRAKREAAEHVLAQHVAYFCTPLIGARVPDGLHGDGEFDPKVAS